MTSGECGLSGDDVLKETESAVVWWLSRKDEKVEGAVDRIGLLADSPTRTRPHRRRPVTVATGAMK